MAALLAYPISNGLSREVMEALEQVTRLSIEDQQREAVCYPENFAREIGSIIHRFRDSLSRDQLFIRMQLCRSVQTRSRCPLENCPHSHSVLERYAFGCLLHQFSYYKTSHCHWRWDVCPLGPRCSSIHEGELGRSRKAQKNHAFYIRAQTVSPRKTIRLLPPAPASVKTSAVTEERWPPVPLPVEGFSFFSHTYV